MFSYFVCFQFFIVTSHQAKEAPDELVVEPEPEEESLKSEKTETDAASPLIVPKKKNFRGVPVMPALPGSAAGAGPSEPGDTPSWLKQLKTRTSLKQREPAALSVASKKVEDAPKAIDFLAQLRKSPKPDESGSVPAKPHLAFTPTKNIGHFQSLKSRGTASTQGGRFFATETSEKAKSVKVFQKSKSEADVLVSCYINLYIVGNWGRLAWSNAKGFKRFRWGEYMYKYF